MQANSGYGEDDIQMMFLDWFGDTYREIARKGKEAARKQKHIDRIAWRAEDAQRKAKGMHFK